MVMTKSLARKRERDREREREEGARRSKQILERRVVKGGLTKNKKFKFSIWTRKFAYCVFNMA